ncbi:unnamed protein product [Discosporangium mesarthrocarpum]
MLSLQSYGEAIDVWSAGCILGEMFRRKPLFAGNDYIHQLRLITQMVGKPTEEDMHFITNPRARRFMQGMPNYEHTFFDSKFCGADKSGVDLLSKMLTLDPSKRITVNEALEHVFLLDEHMIGEEPTAAARVNWEDVEGVKMTKPSIQHLIISDMCHFHPECKELLRESTLHQCHRHQPTPPPPCEKKVGQIEKVNAGDKTIRPNPQVPSQSLNEGGVGRKVAGAGPGESPPCPLTRVNSCPAPCTKF